jgi:ABC-2 type transport system permease protein
VKRGTLHALRIFFRLQLLQLRTQLEYEADFMLGILGMLLSSGANFTFVWVLFSQVPMLGGWTLWEAVLLYALLLIPRGLADLLCDGVWQTSLYVQRGSFDRVFLRPLPLVLQVFSWSSKLHGLGNCALGGWLLLSASQHLHLEWTLFRGALLAFVLINSLLIIASVTLAANCSTFWTEGQSNGFAVVLGILADAVQAPVTIYGRGIKYLLTWVLPFAFVSYYPACILLRKPIEPSWMAWLVPLSGLATAACASLVWRAGVARYESTGQ